ncbi:integrase core domain-containing protein [Kistimonas asteriae]|uniref:integrase core domain-containing protein n=1 Tax=Kistimonas asteriae TaxID=517724 RepID=UPI001BABF1B0|nr:integrase core domain-containing protein [Kistimonas asteriae]
MAELKKFGMVCSMIRKGNCWDNAVIERFFGSLKRERTDHTIYDSRREAEHDVVNHIMFYNNHRLHSYLNYCSTVAIEEKNSAKAA